MSTAMDIVVESGEDREPALCVAVSSGSDEEGYKAPRHSHAPRVDPSRFASTWRWILDS